MSSGALSRSCSRTNCGLSASPGLGRGVAERVQLLPSRDRLLPRLAVGRGGPAGEAVAQHGDEGLDHEAAVAGDADVGPADLAELGGVDVDVDDLGLGGEGGDLAGDPVVEPAAQRDQQVGALHRGDGGVVAVHARHAEREAVRVGEGAPGHQRGDHVDVAELGQLAQRLGRPGLEDAAAGVDHRTGRREDQVGRLLDELAVADGLGPVARAGRRGSPGRSATPTPSRSSGSSHRRCPWGCRAAPGRGGRSWRCGRPPGRPGGCPGPR